LVNPLSLQTQKKKKGLKHKEKKKKEKKRESSNLCKGKGELSSHKQNKNKTTLACMQSVLSCTGLDIYSSLGIWASSSSSIGVGNGPGAQNSIFLDPGEEKPSWNHWLQQ
jgi:hypothetical protein